MIKSLINKIALSGALFITFIASAQLKKGLVPTTGVATLTATTAKIYDGGGGTGNYTNNNDGYLTIIPETSGQYIRLAIDSMELQSGDFIAFYDGDSPSSKLIGKYTYQPNGTLCAVNPSGALTVRFYSNASGVSKGFVLSISSISKPSAPYLKASIGFWPGNAGTPIKPGTSISIGFSEDNFDMYSSSNPNIAYVDSHYVEFYLSKDNMSFPSNDDISLNNYRGYPLPTIFGNGRNANTYNLSLPINLEPSTYYIKAVLRWNGMGVISYPPITNASIKIEADLNRPDFSLKNLKTVASVRTRAPFKVSAKEYNTGNISGSDVVGYYLSANNTFESSDLFLGEGKSTTINTGDSMEVDAQLIIPSSVSMGKYYVIAKANYKNNTGEISINNNVAVTAIEVGEIAYPDLVLQNFKSMLSITTQGGQIPTTLVLSNIGTTFASQSAIRYYLSKDSIWDATDTYMTQNQSASLSLDMGASRVVNTNIGIGSNLAVGNYYIIAKANPLAAEQELNMNNNNSKALPITVTPSAVDLELISVTSSKTTDLRANNEMSIQVTEKNIGINSVGAHSISLYVSTDSIYDRNIDKFMTNVSISECLAKGTASGTGFFYIPNLPTGTYYVVGLIDWDNYVTEVRKDNNSKALKFNIIGDQRDLQIISMTATDSVLQGTDITVSYTESNVGDSYSLYHDLRFCLSKDSVYDVGDEVLHNYNSPSFASNTLQKGFVTFKIPNSIVPRKYYIVAITDPLNTILETNDKNNTRVLPVTVTASKADLIISSGLFNANLPYVSKPTGASVYIRYVEKNMGQTLANAHNLNCYFSKDSVFSTDDLLLTTVQVGAIPAGVSVDVSATISIPNQPIGNYYIVAAIDPAQAILETNRTNNTKALPLDIVKSEVDFQLLEFTSKTTALTHSRSMSVKSVFKNEGNVYSQACTLSYYLSQDSVYSMDDVKLGETNFGSLEPTKLVSYETTLTIPSTTQARSYYMIAVTDANQAVAENNESNNSKAIAFTVLVPTIDLSSVSVPVVSKISADQKMTLKVAVSNKGNFAAGAYKIGYYLSKDTVLGVGDSLLTYSSLSGLSPEVVASSHLSDPWFQIPTYLALGKYYILTVTDYENKVVEIDEANNVSFFSFEVMPSTIDLEVTSLTTSATTILQGGNFSTTVTYINASYGYSTGYSLINYFISKDTIKDGLDLQIVTNNSTIYVPLPQNTISRTYSLYIPTTSDTGDVYLLVVLDGSNVKEVNKSNNTKAFKIRAIKPIVDLKINQSDVTISTLKPRQATTVTSSIQNMGNVSSSYNISYILSKDTIYDVNDYLFTNSATSSSIGLNEIRTLTNTLTIPESTVGGAYYLLVRLGAVNDIDNTNNDKNIKIEVSPTSPDLVVPSFTLDRVKIIQGTSFTANLSGKNIGNGFANTQYVGYYLSKDTVYDASDTYLQGISANPLSADSSFKTSTTFTISNTTAPGAYYVIAVIDYLKTVAEANELNNTKAVQMLVEAATIDVMTSALKAPSWIEQGKLFMTTYYKQNLGNTNINSYTIDLYFSKDTLYDASDVAITSYSTSAPVGTSSLPTGVTIAPPSTLTGNIYVLVVSDPKNAIKETDETNNVSYIKVTISQPNVDLRLDSASVNSKEVNAGNTLPIFVRYSNIGTTPSPISPIPANIYLSKDTLYEATDLLLTSMSTSNLSPDSAFKWSYSLTIPKETAQGDYYVLFVVDPANLIAENIEGNNQRYFKIKVNRHDVDLAIGRVVSFQPNADLLTAKSLYVNYSILNKGSQSVGNYKMSFVISQDTVYQSTDVLLYESGVLYTSGPNSESETYSINFQIPTSLTTGAYYILAVVDRNNTVSETNESNNVKIYPVYVSPAMPELRISEWEIPTLNTSALANGVLSISGYAGNAGVKDASTHYVGYYLSLDSLPSNDDVLLKNLYVSYTAPNSSYSLNAELYVSPALANGTYYLIIALDHTNLLAEANENNNIKAIKFVLNNPPSDLSIPKINVSNLSLEVGATITSQILFSNRSNYSAGSHFEAFFLSKDTIVDATDSLLTYSYVPLVKGKDSCYVNLSFKTLSSIKQGDYYLLAVADYFKIITESNENNNIKAIKLALPVVTGTEEVTESSRTWGVYPNPSKGIVYLVNDEGAGLQADVYDMEGRLLLTKQVTQSLDLEALPQGIYVVKIKKADVYVHTERVVITQ